MALYSKLLLCPNSTQCMRLGIVSTVREQNANSSFGVKIQQ